MAIAWSYLIGYQVIETDIFSIEAGVWEGWFLDTMVGTNAWSVNHDQPRLQNKTLMVQLRRQGLKDKLSVPSLSRIMTHSSWHGPWLHGPYNV